MIKKQTQLLLLGLSSLFAVSAEADFKLPAVAAERPNVLFFITDDESWLERSAYGWSTLPTPHFDRVAKEGVLFTNGFTSAPSCAPSRASVLTGRNFWELKQGAFIQAYLPKEFPVFTHLLAKNGYHVGNTHKVWGPGVYNKYSHGGTGGAVYNKAKVPNPPPGITDNDYAANFELFLKDRKPGQPFFFWAGIFEPHGPFGPENYLRLEKEFGITLDQTPMPPYMEDTVSNRKHRANLLYEICYADLHLGRMLAHLERIGELDNTLIVVTSDNGTPVGAGNHYYGKASPYDYGVHVPLAVMWPSRVSAGRTVTDFVAFADFAPTFLDVAGIQPPSSMSGRSMLPLLESKQSGRIDPERNFIVTGLEWHGEFDPVSRSSRSIRDDRYAYIIRYNNVDEAGAPLGNEQAIKPAKVEFYDLKNDPWQMNNLVDDPTFAKEVERLGAKLRQIGMQTGDPRVTGEMYLFRQARQYVQTRKRLGYGKTKKLPFDEVTGKKP